MSVMQKDNTYRWLRYLNAQRISKRRVSNLLDFDCALLAFSIRPALAAEIRARKKRRYTKISQSLSSFFFLFLLFNVPVCW